MGGEPVEIAAKIVVGALAMLWNDIQAIGWGATAYFILLFVDAVFGAVIAQRKGKGFKTRPDRLPLPRCRFARRPAGRAI